MSKDLDVKDRELRGVGGDDGDRKLRGFVGDDEGKELRGVGGGELRGVGGGELRVLEGFMSVAIREARKAGRNGDVPVGAVIVRDGEIIAAAYNRRECDHDATAHAETLAIRIASKKLERWNLSDCDLYCTLEPCAMCAGAIVNARIKSVVFGASDPRFGCGGSLHNLLESSGLNHSPKITSGIKQKECAALMTTFFETLRKRKKALQANPENALNDSIEKADIDESCNADLDKN